MYCYNSMWPIFFLDIDNNYGAPYKTTVLLRCNYKWDPLVYLDIWTLSETSTCHQSTKKTTEWQRISFFNILIFCLAWKCNHMLRFYFFKNAFRHDIIKGILCRGMYMLRDILIYEYFERWWNMRLRLDTMRGTTLKERDIKIKHIER